MGAGRGGGFAEPLPALARRKSSQSSGPAPVGRLAGLLQPTGEWSFVEVATVTARLAVLVDAEFKGSRDQEVQEFKGSRVQRFKSSKVQEVKGSKAGFCSGGRRGRTRRSLTVVLLRAAFGAVDTWRPGSLMREHT